MISIDFNIRNPWTNTFKNLWCKAFAVPFEHKFIELEIYRSSTILSVSVNYTIRCDHAGLDILVGMLGYNLHFNFYDSRHWNTHTNDWEIYKKDQTS
jgi:hypothetical protein